MLVAALERTRMHIRPPLLVWAGPVEGRDSLQWQEMSGEGGAGEISREESAPAAIEEERLVTVIRTEELFECAVAILDAGPLDAAGPFSRTFPQLFPPHVLHLLIGHGGGGAGGLHFLLARYIIGRMLLVIGWARLHACSLNGCTRLNLLCIRLDCTRITLHNHSLRSCILPGCIRPRLSIMILQNVGPSGAGGVWTHTAGVTSRRVRGFAQDWKAAAAGEGKPLGVAAQERA